MRTKKDRGNRDNSIRKSHYFAPKIPLFGGHLVDYVRESGQPIPRVVSSCIRTINLHGFCHQVQLKLRLGPNQDPNLRLEFSISVEKIVERTQKMIYT